ncbi:MAG: GNAT family N-acetyltransferase [Acidobacteriota bacterium]|nr:GNAT family N-acetyltransferase [Acidobacteriota bacterium]
MTSVRELRPWDFPAIHAISKQIYPDSPAWSDAQLASHLAVFPDGQLIAEVDGEVLGMAASLIVLWDDYSLETSWREFTANGTFTNHDAAKGRTLYGAEIMVHPDHQGEGIGKALYEARRDLCEKLGLLRIRAGARLAGYHRYAVAMSPETYTEEVVKGELSDPTLSFQLGRGFEVLGVARDYLRHDPESFGHAAVIEWINPEVATPADYGHGDPRYRRR